MLSKNQNAYLSDDVLHEAHKQNPVAVLGQWRGEARGQQTNRLWGNTEKNTGNDARLRAEKEKEISASQKKKKNNNSAKSARRVSSRLKL